MRASFAKIFFRFSFLAAIITMSGCLKGDFDSPPTGGVDPDISVDKITTLTEIMSTYYVAGQYTTIPLDKYIKGIVVADDKSGNFYKTLIVEDENSDLGIAVLIDENEIHATLPVGRRVFIKLNGLTVSDYNGLPQLGMGIDNSGTSPRLGYIPSTLMTEIVVPGKFNIPVEPRVKKITELTSTDLNTLIKLENVQFVSAGSGQTYANNTVDPPLTINQDLTDCNNNKIIVRNSGYADFAGALLPAKNGSLTAVYSIFRSDKQLFIRDTTDVAFSQDRCGGGTSGNRISIQAVRQAFANGATTAPAGFVQGVVISDVTNGNIVSQNMVVQDGDYGIVLRFKNAITVPVNTEIKMDVSGATMEEFSKLLQVTNLDNTKLEVLSSKTVTPKVLTVSQIDLSVHESTLIKISGATITGGPTYGSSTVKVKDGSADVQLYTRSAASFSGQNVAVGAVNVTAIVSEFTSGAQLTMRNLSDIESAGPCNLSDPASDCDGDGVANGQDCSPENKDIYPGGPCDDSNAATVNDQYDSQCMCMGSAPQAGLDETFSSQTNNQDINLSGWVNVAVKGTRKWQGKLFSGNTYAQATAFNDTNPDMETWLITPPVNTNDTPTLTFESAKSFWVHDGLSVWATTNFTGDPATTTWTQVSCRIAVQSDADNTFIPSGNIDLKPFGPNIRIGFKYVGKGGTLTSTYRVDNVKIK